MDDLDLGDDWISTRAVTLLHLAMNIDEVSDKRSKELIYRMMNKLVDSISLPPAAQTTRLGVVVEREE